MQRKSYRVPSNPILASLIGDLNDFSFKKKAPIWRTASKMLNKPNRKRVQVNLSKIDRYVNEGETVLVPGKVLATGDMNKGLTVAAFAFSKTAIEKITSANGRAITIRELMKENPKGSNVRIIS